MEGQCREIIVAQADIKNLKERDIELQTQVNDICNSVGRIEGHTSALVEHRLKEKHWPKDIKNKNGNCNHNHYNTIKDRKLEIISGLIFIVITVIGAYLSVS